MARRVSLSIDVLATDRIFTIKSLMGGHFQALLLGTARVYLTLRNRKTAPMYQTAFRKTCFDLWSRTMGAI
jgi:hypothetical protein